MANKIRSYTLKRLDKANIQRSLQGAVKRSDDGMVALSFCTKSAVLPDEYDQLKKGDGGAYLEVDSDGIFWKDYLHIVIFGYGEIGSANFESDMGIKLCEIDGSIEVRYKYKQPCDGCQEKTCGGCAGKELVEAELAEY